MNGLELRRFSFEERQTHLRAELAELGAEDARRVATALARQLDRSAFAMGLERVLVRLRQAASPVAAAFALVDIAERMESSRLDPSPLWRDAQLRIVVTLAGASSWAARVMASDPSLVTELVHLRQQGDLKSRARFEDAAERLASARDTPDFDARLRRFRNRHLLRIALRELEGTSIVETSAELSELASACTEASLLHHRRALEARYGRPDPPNACVVIGMGKLGGNELNFSSDIDVIYAYEHDEGTVGDLAPHPYFVKLFERVTASLRDASSGGFVFRVDLDLRPEGRRGPLTNSVAGLERYYETWGRTWERAAWIRARPIAGDAQLGREIMDRLRPFVYRRSLDLSQVEALVEMKARIDREAAGRRLRGTDLKLGRGGIRELEFFVQAHQLLFGGRDPRLRAPNTLAALRALNAAGHVTSRTREDLIAAHELLRRVEHRVQMVDDQQTHVLPSDAAARERLARSLGYTEPDELGAAVGAHMTTIAGHFDELLGRVDDDDPVAPEIGILLDADADPTERAAAAHELGAQRPDAAVARIEAASRVPGGPLHRNAPLDLRRVGERLVRDCFESPDADRAVTHLPELLRALSAHSSYVRNLEQASVRRGLAQLLGTSDLLARILVDQPPLIPLLLRSPGPRPQAALEEDLRGALEAAGEETEVRLDAMRRFKREEILRTALADLGGSLSLDDVDARLTGLAEASLEQVIALAVQESAARYGELEDGGLVIVAGGALGAREMSYSSDVDLSAIYVGSGESSGGRRGTMFASELFTRLVQRVIAFLTMPLTSGPLYPVDLRLRPSGHQGTLVTSLDAFLDYHARSAQLWERQALVRSRPVWGPAALVEKVQTALHAAAYEGPPPVAGQIRDMRDRLAEQSSDPTSDLKLGPGGLIEVQFLVQHWLLDFAREHPELRVTQTRTALRKLAEGGFIDALRAERLIEAHDRIRQAQNYRRLVGSAQGSESSPRGERAELGLTLDEARRYVRETYRRALGAA